MILARKKRLDDGGGGGYNDLSRAVYLPVLLFFNYPWLVGLDHQDN